MSQKLVIKINNPSKTDSTIGAAPKTVTVYHWDRIIAGVVATTTLTLALVGWWSKDYWLGTENKTVADLPPIQADMDSRETDNSQALVSPMEVNRQESTQVSSTPKATRDLTESLAETSLHSEEGEHIAGDTALEESKGVIVSGISMASGEVSAEPPNEVEENYSPASPPIKLNSDSAGIAEASSSAEVARGQLSRNKSDQLDIAGKPVIEVLTPNFSRVVLARDVNNFEPVNEVLSTVEMGDQNLIKVVVFTEMQNFEGKEVFHDWYLNNKKMAQVRIRPHRSPMRASSSKYIDQNMTGDWKVMITNKNNILLANVTFKVI